MKGSKNMGDIVIVVVLASIIIGIVVWMVNNVRHGKSFCGAELPEPLNIKENLTKNQQLR